MTGTRDEASTAGFKLLASYIFGDNTLLPPARFAAVTFSGLAHEDDVALRTAELKAYMATHALQPLGPPALALSNPPGTLWFMRRNEALIPVAP